MVKIIKIYCDGACEPNPGKGSWGALVQYLDGRIVELSGSAKEHPTTNNRMEILAAIKALESLPDGQVVDIYSDSRYLINGMSKGFKKMKKNRECWAHLKGVASKHTTHWHWIKGHNGHPLQERADQLANPIS